MNVDTPGVPQNISYKVEEYHHNSSTVIVNWNRRTGNRVDFYHYHIITDNNHTEQLIVYNTSATLSEIPYNTNVLFSLTANNCIGDSSPVEHIIYISKYQSLR